MAPDKQEPVLNQPLIRDAEDGRRYRSHGYAARKEPPAMTDGELLAAILGSSHETACARAIETCTDLRTLAGAHPADLRQHGLTTGAVEKLAAVFEIARRYGETPWISGEPFKGSYDVYAHFRERLATETVEYFIAVLLDNKNRKLKDVVVGQGSLTASIVHPRDVFSRVIRDCAAAVIFVHNHPSGDATPSREDLEITRRLRDVGELIGVRVLDHIIIGRGRYISFVDDGYW
jgi:DNA repair protein RadC